MTTPGLKELATQIVALTFRDLVAFSTAIKATGYESEKAHQEKILDWAEKTLSDGEQMPKQVSSNMFTKEPTP
jgi:replicative DNA helicase